MTTTEQHTTTSTRTGIPRALWAIEELRLSEARLVRRRQGACGPSQSTREVLRLVVEAADRDEQITPSELSRKTNISSPGMTGIIKKLVGAELVRCITSPGDARSKIVVPVNRNDPDAVDPVTDRIRAIADDLDPATADALARVLERVRDVVDAECR